MRLSERRTRAVQSEPRIPSTFVKEADAGRVEVTCLGHRLGVSAPTPSISPQGHAAMTFSGC